MQKFKMFHSENLNSMKECFSEQNLFKTHIEYYQLNDNVSITRYLLLNNN